MNTKSFRHACKKSYKELLFQLTKNFRIIFKLIYKNIYRPKSQSIDKIIDVFSKQTSNLTVVQVGANDGFNNDPICKFIIRDNWQGVLVEPQKYTYERYLYPLHKQNKRIYTINAAVGYEKGNMPLYKISFCDDRWATGLATFDKDNLIKMVRDGSIDRRAKKYGIPLPATQEEYITTENVAVINPSTIISKYNIEHIDLLMIDTEGFDYHILNMFLSAQLIPSCIIFEHFHFSEEEAEQTASLLSKHQFIYKKYKGNAIAILNKPEYSNIHALLNHD